MERRNSFLLIVLVYSKSLFEFDDKDSQKMIQLPLWMEEDYPVVLTQCLNEEIRNNNSYK